MRNRGINRLDPSNAFKCLTCITHSMTDMILGGRRMKFASRKQLNQQKKTEKQFDPAKQIHLSKKQMVVVNAIFPKLTASMSCMSVARPGRLELPTLCLEGRCSIQLSYGRLTDSKTFAARRTTVCYVTAPELCQNYLPLALDGDTKLGISFARPQCKLGCSWAARDAERLLDAGRWAFTDIVICLTQALTGSRNWGFFPREESQGAPPWKTKGI
jgi:hypothetical protein